MGHLSSVISLNDTYKRAPTKTITFTGGAGLGLASDIVLVYTITGRVRLHLISAFCTTLLTESGATATISLGTTTTVNGLIAVTNSVDLDANEWWVAASPVVSSSSPVNVHTGGVATITQVDKLVHENININCLVTNTTGGVVIFDAWYESITSTGSLT